jgi:uncharacterized protein DUF4190
MTYPPQQPGNWSDPSWPPGQQPYADPTSGAPGYQAYPEYPAQASPAGYPAQASPAGYPAQASPAGYPAYGYGTPMPAAPATNGMAVAALVCSLAGLVTCISAPVGAILGHVARKQIRERGGGGDGMALAGVIVGWIITGLGLLYLAFVVIFVIFAAGSAATSPNPYGT